MAHIQLIDDLVKEYLLFRGFNQTLRILDNDLKVDKDKGFRIDRITDQILSHIHTYDLMGLKDFWNHLDKRLFIKLYPSMNQHVKKLETSILRLYVINTIQTNKQEKLNDFFEKMSPELHSQAEWKEWFALPYLKNPEESSTFAMFFSRQWQDTLMVSLTNFLSIIFQNIPFPTLARYEEESAYISSLQEEMEHLNVRLNAALNVDSSLNSKDDNLLCDTLNSSLPAPPPPAHLMDDFYNIAQVSSVNSESQGRSLKNLFGFGAPPPPGTERSRTQTVSNTQAESGRRTSSQAPPEDRRRCRSSSLAANAGHSSTQDKQSVSRISSKEKSQDHQPVKRLVGSRRSRSPHMDRSTRNTISEHSAPFAMQNEMVLRRESDTVAACAIISHNSRMVAIGDVNSSVNVYTNTSPNKWQSTPTGVTSGGRGSVAALSWLGEGDRVLFSATHYGHISLWDTRELRGIWEGGPDTMGALRDKKLMCAAVTPSSSSVILSVAHRVRSSQHSPSSNNSPNSLRPNSVLLFDVKTKLMESTYNLPAGCSVNSCEINHNGSLVVCACSDGSLRIIDLRVPDIIASWSAHKGQVFTVKLSNHQDKIYSIGSDNKLSCWSLTQTGGRLLEHSLHKQAAGPFMVNTDSGSEGSKSVLLRPYGSLFALHDNDKYIFTCSATGSTIYEVEADRLLRVQEFGNQKQPIITLDWNATEKSSGEDGLCVTASLDGSVSLTHLTGFRKKTTD